MNKNNNIVILCPTGQIEKIITKDFIDRKIRFNDGIFLTTIVAFDKKNKNFYRFSNQRWIALTKTDKKDFSDEKRAIDYAVTKNWVVCIGEVDKLNDMELIKFLMEEDYLRLRCLGFTIIRRK